MALLERPSSLIILNAWLCKLWNHIIVVFCLIIVKIQFLTDKLKFVIWIYVLLGLKIYLVGWDNVLAEIIIDNRFFFDCILILLIAEAWSVGWILFTFLQLYIMLFIHHFSECLKRLTTLLLNLFLAPLFKLLLLILKKLLREY